jgi:hypothetical protein
MLSKQQSLFLIASFIKAAQYSITRSEAVDDFKTALA